MTWVVRSVVAAALVAVGWCALTAWPAIIHGHPLYAVLLGLTVAIAVIVGARALRPCSPHENTPHQDASRTRPRARLRFAGRVVLAVLAVGWVGLMAWLRPFQALEPSLAAMESDAAVTVTESATQLVLAPAGEAIGPGLVFQPGAKVEARAYAAVLRPLAEAGTLVVVPKQPLGIAFLATGAFEAARSAQPQVTGWVVGGHSLGGTVAAIDADAHDTDPAAPVVGLMLWASYPASDLSRTLRSQVLSVSATRDGLADPATIKASRSDLPAGAAFTAIDGASHASFGDYGPQPGDGTPSLSADDARDQITRVSLEFLTGLPR